jgi:transcription initiation factor TFIID subunit 12
MADPPPASVSVSPQPDQLAGSVSTPQNPNPTPLLSPQIPPSPTVSDLSAHISSPQQLDPGASAGGSMDFPPRPPPQQLQAASPTQANAGYGQQIHRSVSASRLASAGQIPQYAAMAARMYSGQMSFSGNQQQQQQQLAVRAAMLGQNQLGMLQGQGNAASAAHFGLQSQMMVQVNC